MGASPFQAVACGDTMQVAFGEAVRQAQYEYGHRGYTGTIAEKDRFLNAGRLPVTAPIDYVISLFNAYPLPGSNIPGDRNVTLKAAQAVGLELDERRMTELVKAYDDKWGPAVGFELAEGATEEEQAAGLKRYVFVGWASC